MSMSTSTSISKLLLAPFTTVLICCYVLVILTRRFVRDLSRLFKYLSTGTLDSSTVKFPRLDREIDKKGQIFEKEKQRDASTTAGSTREKHAIASVKEIQLLEERNSIEMVMELATMATTTTTIATTIATTVTTKTMKEPRREPGNDKKEEANRKDSRDEKKTQRVPMEILNVSTIVDGNTPTWKIDDEFATSTEVEKESTGKMEILEERGRKNNEVDEEGRTSSLDAIVESLKRELTKRNVRGCDAIERVSRSRSNEKLKEVEQKKYDDVRFERRSTEVFNDNEEECSPIRESYKEPAQGSIEGSIKNKWTDSDQVEDIDVCFESQSKVIDKDREENHKVSDPRYIKESITRYWMDHGKVEDMDVCFGWKSKKDTKEIHSIQANRRISEPITIKEPIKSDWANHKQEKDIGVYFESQSKVIDKDSEENHSIKDNHKISEERSIKESIGGDWMDHKQAKGIDICFERQSKVSDKDRGKDHSIRLDHKKMANIDVYFEWLTKVSVKDKEKDNSIRVDYKRAKDIDVNLKLQPKMFDNDKKENHSIKLNHKVLQATSILESIKNNCTDHKLMKNIDVCFESQSKVLDKNRGKNLTIQANYKITKPRSIRKTMRGNWINDKRVKDIDVCFESQLKVIDKNREENPKTQTNHKVSELRSLKESIRGDWIVDKQIKDVDVCLESQLKELDKDAEKNHPIESYYKVSTKSIKESIKGDWMVDKPVKDVDVSFESQSKVLDKYREENPKIRANHKVSELRSIKEPIGRDWMVEKQVKDVDVCLKSQLKELDKDAEENYSIQPNYKVSEPRSTKEPIAGDWINHIQVKDIDVCFELLSKEFDKDKEEIQKVSEPSSMKESIVGDWVDHKQVTDIDFCFDLQSKVFDKDKEESHKVSEPRSIEESIMSDCTGQKQAKDMEVCFEAQSKVPDKNGEENHSMRVDYKETIDIDEYFEWLMKKSAKDTEESHSIRECVKLPEARPIEELRRIKSNWTNHKQPNVTDVSFERRWKSAQLHTATEASMDSQASFAILPSYAPVELGPLNSPSPYTTTTTTTMESNKEIDVTSKGEDETRLEMRSSRDETDRPSTKEGEGGEEDEEKGEGLVARETKKDNRPTVDPEEGVDRLPSPLPLAREDKANLEEVTSIFGTKDSSSWWARQVQAERVESGDAEARLDVMKNVGEEVNANSQERSGLSKRYNKEEEDLYAIIRRMIAREIKKQRERERLSRKKSRSDSDSILDKITKKCRIPMTMEKKDLEIPWDSMRNSTETFVDEEEQNLEKTRFTRVKVGGKLGNASPRENKIVPESTGARGAGRSWRKFIDAEKTTLDALPCESQGGGSQKDRRAVARRCAKRDGSAILLERKGDSLRSLPSTGEDVEIVAIQGDDEKTIPKSTPESGKQSNASTQTEHAYVIRAVRSCLVRSDRRKQIACLQSRLRWLMTNRTRPLNSKSIWPDASCSMYRKASDNLIYEKGKGSTRPSYIPITQRFRWRYVAPSKSDKLQQRENKTVLDIRRNDL